MPKVSVYECDRCKWREDADFLPEGWVGITQFPYPSIHSHISRTDCVAVGPVCLCKRCHVSLRKWWVHTAEFFVDSAKKPQYSK